MEKKKACYPNSEYTFETLNRMCDRNRDMSPTVKALHLCEKECQGICSLAYVLKPAEIAG